MQQNVALTAKLKEKVKPTEGLTFVFNRIKREPHTVSVRQSVRKLRWAVCTLMVLLSAAYVVSPGGGAMARESKERAELNLLDGRVLAVAHRLTTSAAARCPNTMPGLGLTFHSADQYARANPALRESLFPGGASLAVQGVLAAGPASMASISAFAPVLSINTWQPEQFIDVPGQLRLHAHAYLTTLPASEPVMIVWRKGEQQVSTSITPVPACEVLVEVVASKKRFARSNGPIIQISSRFVDMLDDDQLAVVLAHELAHTALEHRKSLEAQDVSTGLFAEFGKSGRLKRAAEIEADRVSLHILHDAGYDPAIGPAFWRSKIGKMSSGGIFRRRYYPSAKKRAELMDKELLAMKSASDSEIQ